MLHLSSFLGQGLAWQATVMVDTGSGRSWKMPLCTQSSLAHLCKPGASILERHAGLILLSRPNGIVKVQL